MIYKMKKKSEINISIIILNFNSHEFTINCLKSIELSIDKYLEYEIIVVDNGSNINDFKLLNQKIEKNSYKLNIKVLRNKTNLGFGGGNMIGAKESIGKYIAFINNDTLLLNNCFNILFDFMEKNPKVALCGPQGYDSNKKSISSFNNFFSIKKLFFGRKFLELISPKKFPRIKKVYHEPLVVDYVEGSFMFFKAKYFRLINGFDQNIFLYYEETDVGIRLRNSGLLTYLIPKAKYIHFKGGSTKRSIQIKKELKISLFYIIRKHYSKTTFYIVWIYFLVRYFLRIPFKPSYWILFKNILYFTPKSNSIRNN